MNPSLRAIFIGLLFTSVLPAQNVELYLSLLEKGRVSEVRENIPELLSRYPENSGVRFLKAITTENGDSAITLFRTIIEDYPESEYASESALKIGEYLFARGLYTQASNQLKSFLFRYPKSKHHQQAMDLMVNAYDATGESDSALIVLKQLKIMYPVLNYEGYGIKGLDSRTREAKLVKLDPKRTSKRLQSIKPKKILKLVHKPLSMDWVVQVGAFGKYQNAKRLKSMIEEGGFPVEIHEVNSNGRRLHAVRVVRFETREEADKTGQKLSHKFGLDFRLIKKPK